MRVTGTLQREAWLREEVGHEHGGDCAERDRARGADHHVLSGAVREQSGAWIDKR